MLHKKFTNWFGFLRLELVVRQAVRYLVEKGEFPHKDFMAHIEKVIIEEMILLKGSRHLAAKAMKIDYRTINKKVSRVPLGKKYYENVAKSEDE